MTKLDFSRRDILVGCTACAASSQAIGFPAGKLALCRFSLTDGWSNYAPSQYITHKAKANDKSGVPQIVERIKSKLSFQNNIDVMIANDENNAMATVAGGKRLLIIDVGFLSKMNGIAGTNWGAIQIIAHEVGHHIAGFSSDNHRAELNADYWSGQALQRLGSSEAVSTKAIMAVGTEEDTESHPNKYRRSDMILAGWNDAKNNKIDYTKCDYCS